MHLRISDPHDLNTETPTHRRSCASVLQRTAGVLEPSERCPNAPCTEDPDPNPSLAFASRALRRSVKASFQGQGLGVWSVGFRVFAAPVSGRHMQSAAFEAVTLSSRSA